MSLLGGSTLLSGQLETNPRRPEYSSVSSVDALHLNFEVYEKLYIQMVLECDYYRSHGQEFSKDKCDSSTPNEDC